VEKTHSENILNNPLLGYAYHRLILDKNKQPFDFEFLEINTAFEKMTGLKRAACINRTVREILPYIEKEDTDWIAFYGEVALTGEPKELERYSPNLGKWFKIFASSYEKGYFAVMLIDITESKRREEELEKFFSLSLDLLCIADVNGNFIKTNNGWKTILGYTPEELNGSSFMDLVHPDDRESTLAALDTQKQGNKVLNFVNRYQHKDGSYRWIEWHSSPMEDTIYAAARDITERITIEQQLQTKSEQLELAISSGNIGIWNWDLSKNSGFFSPACFEMLGHDDQETPIQMSELLELMHPEDQERVVPQVQKSFASGTAYSQEFRLKAKDGSWKWIQEKGKSFIDASGKPFRAAGLHIDIHERKQNEAALKESEEYHRALLESIPDSVFVVSTDGVFLDYNAAEDDLYVPPETFLQKNLFDILPRPIAHAFTEAIQHMQKTNMATGFSYSLPQETKPATIMHA
jgi:PAS domain S-box-containing protein